MLKVHMCVYINKYIHISIYRWDGDRDGGRDRHDRDKDDGDKNIKKMV